MGESSHTGRAGGLRFTAGTRLFAVVVTCALFMALAAASPSLALGDNVDKTAGSMATENSSGSAEKTPLYGDEKIEVDILAEQVEAAEKSSIVANVKASAVAYRAEALKARIPEQQQRSDQAARSLYKIERNRFDVVEMLLSSQSIDEFIRQVDYIHDITQANMREIRQTTELKAQAQKATKELEKVRKAANKRVDGARESLEEAQAKRIEKAEKGIALAQSQATTLGGAASVGINGAGQKQPSSFRMAASTEVEALDDGADWSQTKEEFVAEWAPRIDAYLKGSPLYGQGENFAKSAWKYCIDPRWSASISNTESSKGSVCIRPHNAWGWGAADSDPYNLAAEWGSWEEAIDAHARGLANGYGYTITIKGAQTYCPYTWQSWYNRTLQQMSTI